MALHSHIERILWSEDQISRQVSDLAAQISGDFLGHSSPPVFVGVATGAFLFLADLVRKIDLPITVDLVRAESYGSGTVSNGSPTISLDLKVDINGRHVILVEDIVDTGHTLSTVIAHLKSKGASSVSVCTLLDKPARRKVKTQLVGEGKFYRGFEHPDGVLKMKKLRKVVLKALQESGIVVNETELSEALEQKSNSSSRFVVENKYVQLKAKD